MRSFWSALEPWHQGVYVNFLGDEGADRVRAGLRGGEVRAAAGAEAQLDPDNFFRINQNIPPA